MSKRVLVVEDQEDNRQILRDLLTNADFEVIEAVDGEAGLVAAATHRPDLILCPRGRNMEASSPTVPTTGPDRAAPQLPLERTGRRRRGST
jgi:DNA-binding NtrC family response regulator